MALINCPECNKEISDRVKACPHCGYPFDEAPAASNANRSGSLKLIAAVCPRCGADLEFDPGLERYFCSFCGSDVIIERKASNTKEESSANAEQYYKAGLEAFREDKMAETLAWLTKAIDADPNYSEAFMLKGVCLGLATPLPLLNADEVISCFQLAQEKFFEKNPDDAAKITASLSYAKNMIAICTVTFDNAQNTYVLGGMPKTQAEYYDYWKGLTSVMNIAFYVAKSFHNSPLILNEEILGVFNEACDLIIRICDQISQSRTTIDSQIIYLNDRDEYISLIENIKNIKDETNVLSCQLKEQERQKRRDEFPEEYKIYQSLIDERDELNSIIEVNKNKLFGENARARKAAEARLKEVLNSLSNFDKYKF